MRSASGARFASSRRLLAHTRRIRVRLPSPSSRRPAFCNGRGVEWAHKDGRRPRRASGRQTSHGRCNHRPCCSGGRAISRGRTRNEKKRRVDARDAPLDAGPASVLLTGSAGSASAISSAFVGTRCDQARAPTRHGCHRPTTAGRPSSVSSGRVVSAVVSPLVSDRTLSLMAAVVIPATAGRTPSV